MKYKTSPIISNIVLLIKTERDIKFDKEKGDNRRKTSKKTKKQNKKKHIISKGNKIFDKLYFQVMTD